MKEKLFTDEEMKALKTINNDKPQKKIRFKSYEIGENYLFPPTTEEYISKNHIARLISLIIDRMNIDFIKKTYKGGGTSAYNPGMLLKVWLLGFVYRIYTSRRLQQALEESLPFIWISAGEVVNFRTLNNFRLRLKGEIKAIFKQVVQLGFEMGIIEGKDVFIDHTKLEADANKHKIVWKKQVKRQLDKIDAELEELFDYIDRLNEDEDKKYGENKIKDNQTRTFDIQTIDKMIKDLNKQCEKMDLSKEEKRESKKKLKRTKELFKRKTDYNLKEQVLGDRNSYSKTDPSATAMMQKDKLNIKPGYNEGIAVENGFVMNYVQSQKSADNVSFKELVEGALDNLGQDIENIHTDGAYGNEENSEYLKEKKINNYLKFNTYRKEKSRKWYREKVRKECFNYEYENDYYICPNGVKLFFEEEKKVKTTTGFQSVVRIYKAEGGHCPGCPYQEHCTESDARSIQINRNYEKHKDDMRSNLDSLKGKELRKRRGFEVESVFGDRKKNKGFHRFVLRGEEKVNIESGLYYTVHNIRKIYHFMMKNWFIPIYGAENLQLLRKI